MVVFGRRNYYTNVEMFRTIIDFRFPSRRFSDLVVQQDQRVSLRLTLPSKRRRRHLRHLLPRLLLRMTKTRDRVDPKRQRLVLGRLLTELGVLSLACAQVSVFLWWSVTRNLCSSVFWSVFLVELV